MAEEQRRKRIGTSAPVQTAEAFTGTPGASVEPSEGLSDHRSIDDDLDPGGKPYRPAKETIVNGQAVEERGADPRVPGGYGRIIRSVFKIDEEGAFASLQKGLTFARKASQMSYGERVDALDEASGMVMLAGQLAANAKVVLTMYELDVEVLRAPMRRDAKKRLVDEKKSEGGKQITNADVAAMIAELWPDEHRRQEENLAKAKAAVAHVQLLAERWGYRAREIETIVRTTPHS